MRYPASEQLEIMRLVEQSHLPVRRTLENPGRRFSAKGGGRLGAECSASPRSVPREAIDEAYNRLMRALKADRMLA